jgi:hypothetical protein
MEITHSDANIPKEYNGRRGRPEVCEEITNKYI